MGDSRGRRGRRRLGGIGERQTRQAPRRRRGGAGREVPRGEIEAEVATSGVSMATSVEEEAVESRHD